MYSFSQQSRCFRTCIRFLDVPTWAKQWLDRPDCNSVYCWGVEGIGLSEYIIRSTRYSWFHSTGVGFILIFIVDSTNDREREREYVYIYIYIYGHVDILWEGGSDTRQQKLHTEELNNLYSLPDIITVIAKRWGELGEHKTWEVRKNTYKFRLQKPKGRDSWKVWLRWKDYIK